MEVCLFITYISVKQKLISEKLGELNSDKVIGIFVNVKMGLL